MSINQEVKGNSVELQIVLQANRAKVDELRNKIRNKIVDAHRTWRRGLLRTIDGAFNAFFTSVERVMNRLAPQLERFMGIDKAVAAEMAVSGDRAYFGLGAGNDVFDAWDAPEREETVIAESRRLVEEANRRRGKFIQSAVHNLKQKMLNGKGERNGKRQQGNY